MNDSALRRHCRDIVGQLDLPKPFNINDLVDQVEERRGRPISLVPMPLPADRGPCGLWVATPEVDYVIYQANTRKAHQGHIVLHEIGHMLCDHRSTPAEEREVSRLLLPNIDPSVVRVVLGRTRYDRNEEKAAELVASLIPLRAEGTSSPSATTPPHVASLVSHLERSLERSSAHGA
ncbi:toxin [Streptomyces coeruleorubidus]|uniref:Toxin n=1 Tax=Streptomyces coeruleorubidus TaxID=116188 RepID=A0ABZ0KRC1_STRC4|nr:toxin [Streptomyces coeruleorubidus]WOT40614.1 toxin [Streptomyces coeruleorubidus]